MANIHLKTSSNGGNIGFSDPTMPKYVGARATVTLIDEGVRIWMSDYKGTTEEIVTAEGVGAIPASDKGAASGVCPLNSSGKVDAAYLPVYSGEVL